MIINTGKTAIKRNKLSSPVQMLYNDDQLQEGMKLFDYGHGRGDDITGLAKMGFEIDGYDPNHYITGYSVDSPDDIKKEYYDFVLCTYVLNTIPWALTRLGVVRRIYSLLDVGGKASFAVRTDKDVARSVGEGWKEYEDGWITTANTFQTGHSRSALYLLLMAGGLWQIELVNSDPLLVVATKEYA